MEPTTAISNEFSDNGYVIAPISTPAIDANLMQDLVLWVSNLSADEERFRRELLDFQARYNGGKNHFRIARALWSILEPVVGSAALHISAVAFLRVVRPTKVADKYEFLDFHRESFYGTGDFVRHQVNIHVPIYGYSKLSAMKFVPRSHTIPDSDFKVQVVSEYESGVTRGSVKHLAGMVYSPKKIIAGCNLEEAIPFEVLEGGAVVFSSQLIHGGGVNLTTIPRVSVDFAVIAERHVDREKNFQIASYSLRSEKYVPLKK